MESVSPKAPRNTLPFTSTVSQSLESTSLAGHRHTEQPLDKNPISNDDAPETISTASDTSNSNSSPEEALGPENDSSADEYADSKDENCTLQEREFSESDNLPILCDESIGKHKDMIDETGVDDEAHVSKATATYEDSCGVDNEASSDGGSKGDVSCAANADTSLHHNDEYHVSVNNSTVVQPASAAKSQNSLMYDVDSASDWDRESDVESTDIPPDDEVLMSSDFVDDRRSTFVTSLRNDCDAMDNEVSEKNTESHPILGVASARESSSEIDEMDLKESEITEHELVLSPVTDNTLSFREKLRLRQEQLRNAEILQPGPPVIADEIESDFSASIDDGEEDDIMHDISDASSADGSIRVIGQSGANSNAMQHSDDDSISVTSARRNDILASSHRAPVGAVSRFGERDLLHDEDSDFDEDETLGEGDLVMSFDESFDS